MRNIGNALLQKRKSRVKGSLNTGENTSSHLVIPSAFTWTLLGRLGQPYTSGTTIILFCGGFAPSMQAAGPGARREPDND